MNPGDAIQTGKEGGACGGLLSAGHCLHNSFRETQKRSGSLEGQGEGAGVLSRGSLKGFPHPGLRKHMAWVAGGGGPVKEAGL